MPGAASEKNQTKPSSEHTLRKRKKSGRKSWRKPGMGMRRARAFVQEGTRSSAWRDGAGLGLKCSFLGIPTSPWRAWGGFSSGSLSSVASALLLSAASGGKGGKWFGFLQLSIKNGWNEAWEFMGVCVPSLRGAKMTFKQLKF